MEQDKHYRDIQRIEDILNAIARIDLIIVWDAVKEDLPPLKKVLQNAGD